MNAITKEESKALTLPERAAVALGAAEHELKLRELVKSSADIVAVIDPAGREQAHRIGMNLKGARVAIEKVGKMAREDATAFSKAIIAEEKRLIAIAEPEEERILSLRDRFDATEKARKDAEIAAERARTEAIEARIQVIRNAPLAVIGKSSAEILTARDAVRDTIISEELFGEQAYRDKAMDARSEAFNALETAFDVAEKAEAAALAAEEARKAEAARIEQERATLAAQRAENERIANEQAATAKRLADQEAAQALAAKQLADKAAANLKAEQDALAEQMRIQREAAAEQQAKLDAQQAEFEALRVSFANEQERARKRIEDAAKMDVDHPEALAMNEQFDADREAERARLQAAADQHLADTRTQPAFSDAQIKESMIAYAESHPDESEVTDKEIMAIAAELGLTPDAWVERLTAFCERMTSVTATGQRYSRTTFKDNGAAIFLNEDGSRSIFCDLAD